MGESEKNPKAARISEVLKQASADEYILFFIAFCLCGTACTLRR